MCVCGGVGGRGGGGGGGGGGEGGVFGVVRVPVSQMKFVVIHTTGSGGFEREKKPTSR